MAQRRMFSPDIVNSDAFLEMPPSTQALYFQLGMKADDDGFVNPKMVMRMMGSSDDELKMLIVKRFVLPFENGVIVIKHWRVNNQMRKDWYRPSIYTEQRSQLLLKENGAYTLDSEQGLPLVNDSVPNRQHSIDKYSIGNTSANAETNLLPAQKGYEVVEDVERPKRTEPLPKTHEFTEVWNRYTDWAKLGKKSTPPNPSVKQGLLPFAKTTPTLTGALVRARNKVSKAEFEQAVKNYVSEVVNRRKDEKGYYEHRYSLYEFLVHKDVLAKYVNK